MCERSNLSMKLDRVLHELHELRTDNEALRSQLTENEKARKTEYEALKMSFEAKLEAQNKSIAVLTNNVNGIRVALTPATFQSMAEPCIYKQAEGLTALLISKGISLRSKG